MMSRPQWRSLVRRSWPYRLSLSIEIRGPFLTFPKTLSLSLCSLKIRLEDPAMTSKMKARLGSKFSPLLKPLKEPSQSFMIFLSFVMLYFVAIGFLSYFNDDPEAFKSDRPFLTSGRDEVSSDRNLSSLNSQISLLSISRLKLILQIMLCPQRLQLRIDSGWSWIYRQSDEECATALRNVSHIASGHLVSLDPNSALLVHQEEFHPVPQNLRMVNRSFNRLVEYFRSTISVIQSFLFRSRSFPCSLSLDPNAIATIYLKSHLSALPNYEPSNQIRPSSPTLPTLQSYSSHQSREERRRTQALDDTSYDRRLSYFDWKGCNASDLRFWVYRRLFTKGSWGQGCFSIAFSGWERWNQAMGNRAIGIFLLGLGGFYRKHCVGLEPDWKESEGCQKQRLVTY